ncbi:Clp protease ClpP [Listeria sp. FSL L7-1582]|uniref:head maturation protease, ClpP-related n=1 Tax=Listeria portnoyi TaxID=2713504 RepID=UPI00164E17A4|nr:head maturation protease, ClpP-related [Listeria portnoyi]MBC6310144.1 Clp protease ClpP [Listeria portnoyi]
MSKPNFYTMKAQGEMATIDVYGPVVPSGYEMFGQSATSFKADLKALGDVQAIELHVNSPGGAVFEGVAIYNVLKNHQAKVTTYIDGLAASIASVIALAGDTIIMPKNALMMIHNPKMSYYGTANEFRTKAEELDKTAKAMRSIYLERGGDHLTEAELIAKLDAETWLDAEEAQAMGYCDVISEENRMVAMLPPEWADKYQHPPTAIIPSANKEQEDMIHALGQMKLVAELDALARCSSGA